MSKSLLTKVPPQTPRGGPLPNQPLLPRHLMLAALAAMGV